MDAQLCPFLAVLSFNLPPPGAPPPSHFYELFVFSQNICPLSWNPGTAANYISSRCNVTELQNMSLLDVLYAYDHTYYTSL